MPASSPMRYAKLLIEKIFLLKEKIPKKVMGYKEFLR